MDTLLQKHYREIAAKILEATLGKSDAWYRGWGTDEKAVLEETRKIFSETVGPISTDKSSDVTNFALSPEVKQTYAQNLSPLELRKTLFMNSFSEVLNQKYPKAFAKLVHNTGSGSDLFEALILSEGNNFLNSPDLETSLAIWKKPERAAENKNFSRDGTFLSGWSFFWDKLIPDFSDPSWKSAGVAVGFASAGIVAGICIPLEMTAISGGLLVFTTGVIILNPAKEWISYYFNRTEENRRDAFESLGEMGQQVTLAAIVASLGHLSLSKMKKSDTVNLNLPDDDLATIVEPPPPILDRADDVFPEMFDPLKRSVIKPAIEGEQRVTLPTTSNPLKTEIGVFSVTESPVLGTTRKKPRLFFHNDKGGTFEIPLSESIPAYKDFDGNLILTAVGEKGSLKISPDNKVEIIGTLSVESFSNLLQRLRRKGLFYYLKENPDYQPLSPQVAEEIAKATGKQLKIRETTAKPSPGSDYNPVAKMNQLMRQQHRVTVIEEGIPVEKLIELEVWVGKDSSGNPIYKIFQTSPDGLIDLTLDPVHLNFSIPKNIQAAIPFDLDNLMLIIPENFSEANPPKVVIRPPLNSSNGMTLKEYQRRLQENLKSALSLTAPRDRFSLTAWLKNLSPKNQSSH